MFLQLGEVLDLWKESLGKPHYLYVLHDPRNGNVCYVGITKQKFSQRLSQHRNPVKSNQTSIAKLQRRLKSDGFTLSGEILAKGSEEFISALEKYIISGFWRYLGKDSIKNHQIGGRDAFGKADETKRKAWETRSKKKEKGFYESREGEKASGSKLTESQVLEIYSLIKQFYSNSEIIDILKLDIGLTGMNQIRKGKCWKYLWGQEKMISIPSMKKESGGLSSPTKIEVVEQIYNGEDIKYLQSKYKLQIADLKRIKEKELWQPVWFIFENFKINNNE
jgi:hypothetical protein